MKSFKWKWQDTLVVILGVLTLGYGLINYGKLPDQLPSHFGISGEVDSYWSKNSVFILAAVMGLLFPIGMQFIRKIDPKRENYERFEHAYKMIRLFIAVVFDAFFVISVSYGLDDQFQAGKWALVLVGLMILLLGNYLPQVKDNYFIGIRTPWTLNNPDVWRRTHRFSGLVWTAGGLLILIGVFLPKPAMVTMLVASLALITILPLFYSWMISERKKA
ncbi:SdpI family protein [Paenibacillus sp. NFR01]|uniref:SdpI family protein n=1 Tax=Paenibacillus sp. NFR01 TaxID=1566279 RepID=UPI0008C9BD60|nr:SdpI family protein [Paenibacillus sp. NFR01]SEU25268.1 Uncharacterized membrane protein [Paenibacillus sp. NFR01]